MDRLPVHFPIADDQPVAGACVPKASILGLTRPLIGRRDLLKHCGAAGLAVWGFTLVGCAGDGDIAEPDSRPSSFFADGTDFVD